MKVEQHLNTTRQCR